MSECADPEKVTVGNHCTILTIGHSTHPVGDFIALLREHGVRRVVDMRTLPRSRHNPQFNRDIFPETLAQEDIGYTHMPGLGGLRHPTADSPNRGWRNESFHGFADYMQTAEFGENMEKLLELGRRDRIALMCAEALPWRCHRSLIADALLVRGAQVYHLMGRGKPVAHELTPFACVDGVTLTYPAVTTGLQGSP